ncbi:MAG TPA: 16S rRNA (adenine(1518)-N(6)/adenine(1519)-N(6))-dimethyltransferase RsmA [Gemmatimonadaceae bacterium]|nr:16S rRNA (adenine(1518)-N(6)/adenine(1519)-N(6))-dimethyltransferase RsmA [Gemmatimonadaceae bacterium]
MSAPRPRRGRQDGGSGRGGFPPTLKRFGQHFLRDRQVLARIADALQLTGTETVVEIGPGRGALTDLLVDRAARLVAVEIDRALAAMLRERYAGRANVEIVEQDVLATELRTIAGTDDFVLVGNVPYYITTPILFHALERPRPSRAVYLVQLEVAERLIASPGSKIYGALSVNVQAVADVELVFRVPPGAFAPPPKVESAVVRVTSRAQPIVAPEDEARFRAFVQAAFGLRRKQLRRVLRTIGTLDAESAERVLATAGVDPDARPETLSPADFGRLVAASHEPR